MFATNPRGPRTSYSYDPVIPFQDPVPTDDFDPTPAFDPTEPEPVPELDLDQTRGA